MAIGDNESDDELESLSSGGSLSKVDVSDDCYYSDAEDHDIDFEWSKRVRHTSGKFEK